MHSRLRLKKRDIWTQSPPIPSISPTTKSHSHTEAIHADMNLTIERPQ